MKIIETLYHFRRDQLKLKSWSILAAHKSNLHLHFLGIVIYQIIFSLLYFPINFLPCSVGTINILVQITDMNCQMFASLERIILSPLISSLEKKIGYQKIFIWILLEYYHYEILLIIMLDKNLWNFHNNLAFHKYLIH